MVTRVSSEKLADPGGKVRTVAEWCRVHEVSPIVKRFGQWVVTSYGLENLCTNYPVEASRLWQGEGTSYTWERHLSEKWWCSQEDFVLALAGAREYHVQHKPKVMKLSMGGPRVYDFAPSSKLVSKEGSVQPEYIRVSFPIHPEPTIQSKELEMTNKKIQIQAAGVAEGNAWCPHCGNNLWLRATSPDVLEPTAEELKVAAQFGNSREALIEQRALDLGLEVPADVAQALAAQRRK
jgi:hypothetical protein